MVNSGLVNDHQTRTADKPALQPNTQCRGRLTYVTKLQKRGCMMLRDVFFT